MMDGGRVFVNERPVSLLPGQTAGDAVRAFDPDLADALAGGRARLTDGVGRPVAPGDVLRPGAILRVALSARRTAPPGGAA